MYDIIQEALNDLIIKISGVEEVRAIGISGKLKPYPKTGNGDFDIFIYCDEIPSIKARQKVLLSCNHIDNIKTNIGISDIWGHDDYCTIDKIDTFLMYFNKTDVLENINDILNGKYLWKIDNEYFPVGRVSMLSNINIFYDADNYLANLKESLLRYPPELKQKMISYHISKMYDDEDFNRAVNRKDIFFFHCTLDKSIEHFMMALYALNEVYFPSRKRTVQYIKSFNVKPMSCNDRLLHVIKNSVDPEMLDVSCEEFLKLSNELKQLCKTNIILEN